MQITKAVSFKDIIDETGPKPKKRAFKSKISGIRSRKNFKRFIFVVKSSEVYSSSKGHLASIMYPDVVFQDVLKRERAKSTPANSNVLVWCTCPAFKYWGSHFWASQADYLIKDKPSQGRPPDIRDPKEENLVCKHLVKVSRLVSTFTFKRLFNVFDTKSKTSSEDFSLLQFKETFPIISEYLQREKYSYEEIEDILFSMTSDNFEDTLSNYNVIV